MAAYFILFRMLQHEKVIFKFKDAFMKMQHNKSKYLPCKFLNVFIFCKIKNVKKNKRKVVMWHNIKKYKSYFSTCKNSKIIQIFFLKNHFFCIAFQKNLVQSLYY